MGLLHRIVGRRRRPGPRSVVGHCRREIRARHRLRRIPFIGLPQAAIRGKAPQRAQQGVQHLPHIAPWPSGSQTSIMRYHEVHAAM